MCAEHSSGRMFSGRISDRHSFPQRKSRASGRKYSIPVLCSSLEHFLCCPAFVRAERHRLSVRASAHFGAFLQRLQIPAVPERINKSSPFQKRRTHKEVNSILQDSMAFRYAVLLFLCRSMVCLSSSCFSSPIKFHTISIFCLRCPLQHRTRRF